MPLEERDMVTIVGTLRWVRSLAQQCRKTNDWNKLIGRIDETIEKVQEGITTSLIEAIYGR
jgi:hypothetical protein